jgi:UrcA family protein
MKTIYITTVATLLGSIVAGNIALAQQPAGAAVEGVTVSASRGGAKPVVSTVGGPRNQVTQVTLTYNLSASNYDLTKVNGVADFEKAVRQTASDVCREIGRQYPDSTPDDGACAKDAADKAMIQVRELVAAANKRAVR